MIVCPQCAGNYPSVLTSCPSCDFCPPVESGFIAWATEMSKAGGGFKAEYFGPLAELEKGNFWFQSRNELITWALKKYCPSMESLLEVGCGTGFVLSRIASSFPGVRLVGSEIFSAGLGFAAARVPTASFVQMDARRTPYLEEFDVVAAFDVIEHIAEDELVFSNLYRALKPGGGLLITVPQHQWLWSAADTYACHVRRYSSQELEDKVRRAGFDIVRSTSFTSLLLPAMFLSRRLGRKDAEFNPRAEFELSPVINAALTSILTMERQLVRLGFSFSVGGSRLLVARKS